MVSTPVHEARTQLFVATRTGADTADLNQGQTFSQARVQSYAAIVATGQVIEPVVRELRLSCAPEQLASRARVDGQPRVIVVTSSVPGEGKTTTAVNLALSFADAGVRTCLVEADLRRPSVARTSGLVQDAGLTTVLIGRAPVEDVVQEACGRLTVLTCGAVPPNPTELLASARMAGVVRELTADYEVVIVDRAPCCRSPTPSAWRRSPKGCCSSYAPPRPAAIRSAALPSA